MFDTIRFLQDYNIPYWESGENVSRSRVGVTCPFCDDTYNHLGLHVSGDRPPYCWKCGKHSIWEYIEKVTGESPKEVMSRYGAVLSGFSEKINIPTTKVHKCIPPGSKNFKQAHKDYLTSRGFDADYLIHKYDLYVTKFGDEYPHRIIFPIKLNNKIVSYQGRSFIGATPKYLTCKPEKEVVFHKDILFDLDNCKKKAVILVEGVFDKIRLGDNSAATFGTMITPTQLKCIKDRFTRVFTLFDSEPKAQEKAKSICKTLSAFGLETENVCLGSGDPGELSEDDALYLMNELNLL